MLTRILAKSVTYTLDRDLLPGTRYEAELDFDIQDEDGNYLDCTDSNDVDSSCRWQFETTGTSGSANIELTPTSGSFGSSVQVAGTGFDPNSDVIITFDSDPVSTKLADNNGDFDATFTVPISVSGSHTVRASDGISSDSKIFTVTSCEDPIIFLNPNSGPVGTSVTVTGCGFAPTSAVTITFDGSALNPASTATPGANGVFTATFNVPES